MRRLPLTAVLLTATVAAHAGVYKCEVDGKTVYQQTPCAAGVATTRVEIQRTPASSRTGGLRASEMQAVQGIVQREQEAARESSPVGLSAYDQSHLEGIYEELAANEDGPNRREAEIAEGTLRRSLKQYDLALEQVEPVLPHESLTSVTQGHLQARQNGTLKQFQAERQQEIDAYRAEQERKRQERRRQAEAMQPVITNTGQVLIPNDPNHNTYTGAGGGLYIRQGNTAVQQ